MFSKDGELRPRSIRLKKSTEIFAFSANCSCVSFASWEAVHDARRAAVIAAIRIAGLANQKGPRIQGVLREITRERGDLDLDFLKQLPIEEARGWLTHFKGVGPKTAAIVLLFSLGRPAFPVDTHIYRVTGRIGLRPAKMSLEQAHLHLESLFRPETYYAAHLNLIRLGRQVCHPGRPDCPNCPVRALCDFEPKTKPAGPKGRADSRQLRTEASEPRG